MYFTWKLWRRINRLEATVEQMRGDVGEIRKEHGQEIADSRRDLNEIKQRVSFLETQAGVMDIAGIED